MSKSIFENDEFKPLVGRWNTRQKMFARRASYYDGSIYKDTRAALSFLGPRLGSAIRPLYLPLARAVLLDAALMPAGWTLAESARSLQTAVKTVLTWSDWRTDGQLFAWYASEYGSVGLKVSDLRDDKRVIVQPLAPDRFMLVATGTYDKSPKLGLIVETRTGDDGADFEYAEVIEPQRVRTFRDGATYPFDGRKEEYPNVLEFVPLVECPFLATGDAVGQSTFQSVIPMLDEVNELATDLAVSIKSYSDPQFFVTGVEEGNLTRKGDNIWYLPQANAKADVVVAPIDVNGILAFVQAVATNVNAGLPELVFDSLINKQQLATATVQLQLMELKAKIGLVRPNLDHGLADALRMAGRAAASMGLSNIAALDSEELAFDSEREIIPLDPESRAQIAKLEAEARTAGAEIKVKSPSPA